MVVVSQLLGDLLYTFFAIHFHGAFLQTSISKNGDLYRAYTLDDNFIDRNKFSGLSCDGPTGRYPVWNHVVSSCQLRCKSVAISTSDILKPPFGIKPNRSSVLVVPIERCSVNSAKAIGVKAIAGSANRILARDM